MKIICQNKRAYYDYAILKKYEAGVCLKGSEVKSLRNNKANLVGSFCKIENGEVFVYQMHIALYSESGPFNNHEPTRKRKLLLHRREISQLRQSIELKGMTVVPLKAYFLKNYAKMEIGVARGKQKQDKRESIKRKEANRQIERALRRRR